MATGGDANDRMMADAAKALTGYTGGGLSRTGATGAGEELDFNDVFSLRRPQNAMSGLSSGLQSAGKGVLAGAAALIAAPAIGAKAEGATGFFKGLGAGLVSAVVLPVVGVGVGATQIVRGIANTPEAIAEANAGKRWNRRTREWVTEDLVKEALKLAEIDDETILEKARERARAREAEERATSGGGGGGGGGATGGGVSETEFYDVLEVAPTASASEIKRAYYVAARKWHPDKCQDDPSAHERFQKIGEAYQVLSDDATRKKYDEKGKAGLGDDFAFADPSAFFAMLFGSDQMESFVGRLQLATVAAAGADLKREELHLLQDRRVARLAVKLAAVLEGFVSGQSEEDFRRVTTAMASELVKASYGELMLHLIGFVYEKQSAEYLADPVAGAGSWADLGVRSGVARAEQYGRRVQTQFAAVGAGLKIFKSYQSAEKEAAGAKTTEEGDVIRAKKTQDMLPHFLEALWNTSALDIESTLRVVCDKVLHDHAVDAAARKKRGVALGVLGAFYTLVPVRPRWRGEVFGAAKAPEGATNDPMKKLEEAMRRAFQGDEDDGDGTYEQQTDC